jgi:hypothetical protein
MADNTVRSSSESFPFGGFSDSSRTHPGHTADIVTCSYFTPLVLLGLLADNAAVPLFAAAITSPFGRRFGTSFSFELPP